MEEDKEEILRRSPDRLLGGFSKGRLLLWAGVAVVVHILFVGATSVGYIRDRWVDPEGAAARKAAAAAEAEARLKPSPPAPEKTAVAATGAVAVARPAAPSTGAAGEEAVPSDRRDTPVVKRITEVAASNEIPKQPTDLGISIDETNVK